MANSSPDDIEASPPAQEPSTPTCTSSHKRAAAVVSAALAMAAIAAGVVVYSQSKRNAQTAPLIAQGATSLEYPVASFPVSNTDTTTSGTADNRQAPQGFTACTTEAACNSRRVELGFKRYIVSSSISSKGCFYKRNTAYFGSGGSPSAISQVDLPGRRERIWCKVEANAGEDEESSFATLSVGEKIVTYLAPFKRIKANGPNVELADGTFYELINLSDEYDDSDWVTGVTSLSIPVGAEFKQDGTVDMKGMMPSFVESVDTRSEGRFVGSKSVLAVRVVAAENKTTGLDEYSLADSIFGIGVDKVNLASQTSDCSYGKLKFTPAEVRSGKSINSGKVEIVNGVTTVHVPSVNVAQGTAVMRNAISKELNTIFGTTNPSELADYVIYCLPPGTFATGTYSSVGYAYYNNWLSVFNNQWCTSVSLQMHEIGHSLNFGHSNENGETYEDGSGNMGASYKSSDRPKMCFNAAKSWQTGWYMDKEVTVGGTVGTACFDGTLHGIADYTEATTVLLKVQGKQTDVFINFNAKKGINQGTQDGGNQVLVVSRLRGKRDSFAVSDLRAKLSAGDSFSFEGYTISVGNINIVAGTAKVSVLPAGQNTC